MRTKTGTVRRRKHKKTIGLTKGYRMTKNRLFRPAHEAMLHAGQYAFIGRKRRKRQFRQLWIIRLNAALKEHGLSYNQFIKKAREANLALNRKILSNLAIEKPTIFQKIISKIGK